MTAAELVAKQRAAGATISPFAGGDVVWDYGDPVGEYRSMLDGAGLVVRSDLRVTRMWGRDPVRMLNGLITNDLNRLTADRAVYGAMLTPKGRMISDLRAVVRGSGAEAEIYFDFSAAAADSLAAHLKKYVPPLFARWELLEDAVVLGVYGPEAEAIVEAQLGERITTAEDAVHVISFDSHRLITIGSMMVGRGPGVELILPEGGAEEVWQALVGRTGGAGARPVGFQALETLRIEAGYPRFGHELSEDTMPAEAYESTGAMERAVSFTKGCYTGQEVVVRIAHRGHVNRHLRGLLLGDAPAPAARSPLFRPADGKEVGWVTSSAVSPRLDQTIALGYVRREVEVGSEIRVGSTDGAVALVAELPFAV